MREGRRSVDGPRVRFPRERSPNMPNVKRRKTRVTREAVSAARGTSTRSTCSSRRRTSRARWSSSTRGTLWLHRLGFGMTPSVARSLPSIAGADHQISRRAPSRC